MAARESDQSSRSAACTATTPQLDGIHRSTRANQPPRPASRTPELSTAMTTIHPHWVMTIIAAVVIPTIAAPVRDRANDPNTPAVTRVATTTSSSWRASATTATRAGPTPSDTPYRARAVKATTVTTAPTPTNEAPVSPVASRHRDSGSRANSAGRSEPLPAHAGAIIHPNHHSANARHSRSPVTAGVADDRADSHTVPAAPVSPNAKPHPIHHPRPPVQ